MKFKGFLWLFFGGIFFLQSCIKDGNNQGGNVVQYSQQQVGILCEGNYMWNNSRFDVFSIDSQKYFSNVFEAVNKMPLGDVLQSGCYSGNYILLCVNNTGKIVALDRKTMKLVKSRGGLKSPRYILPFGPYLFVSDLQNNAVSMLDTGNLATLHEFKVLSGNLVSNRSGWTEQMTVWNNELVAACYDGYLITMNPTTKTTTKMEADTGCQNLVIDANNRLWALSSVNGLASIVAYGSNKKEEKRFAFPAMSSLNRLCISKSGNEVYFIYQNKVCKLPVNATDLKEMEVVYAGAQTCYGLGVDPRNGYIYVADAKDYVSNGMVTILNENHEVIHNYNSGIIPSGFVFF